HHAGCRMRLRRTAGGGLLRHDRRIGRSDRCLSATALTPSKQKFDSIRAVSCVADRHHRSLMIRSAHTVVYNPDELRRGDHSSGPPGAVLALPGGVERRRKAPWGTSMIL